jgi:hypothetical protein
MEKVLVRGVAKDETKVVLLVSVVFVFVPSAEKRYPINKG